jgi:uncharacterized membrane protein YgaE (UPF0421/DUF939 family)
MSQPKNKRSTKRVRALGVALGIVLAIACHVVPPEYQTACEVVSRITATSCGGV